VNSSARDSSKDKKRPPQPTTKQEPIHRTSLGTVVYKNTKSTTTVDESDLESSTDEVTYQVIPEGGDPLPLEDSTKKELAIAEAEKYDEQLKKQSAPTEECDVPERGKHGPKP
jgi:hypothetical protein